MGLDYGKSFMGFTLNFQFVEVKVKESSKWLTVYDCCRQWFSGTTTQFPCSNVHGATVEVPGVG